MTLDFDKQPNGLIPAIVQDADTLRVLMLGYMNAEALEKTQKTGRVTFFSRSKQRLWTKGEASGHFLILDTIKADCDRDSLLVAARPAGPTCHTGADTCWGETNSPRYGFLSDLEATIAARKNSNAPASYTAALFQKGLPKIAQKVGEEAVETVIEALGQKETLFLNESADLLFHFLILLHAKGVQLDAVVRVLQERKN